MTKNDKPRQAGKQSKKRASIAVKGLLEGKTQGEIAEEMGVSRQTVNLLMKSEEVEALLKHAEDRAIRLINKAMDGVEEILSDTDPFNRANRLKAALAILKSKGIVRDTLDLNHNMPKPTVVRYGDKEIRMGAVLTGKEDGAEDDHEN